MENSWLVAAIVYGIPLMGMWTVYSILVRRRDRHGKTRLAEAQEAKLQEPPSLHPDINPHLCAGCGTCVDACPEHDVLAMVDGKAVLVTGANCIGHGKCKTACPMNAITLVFGTATRGVDIPSVGPDFETNVPGIFIAGELGGMGLIRNAIEQGRQAIDSVARRAAAGPRLEHDVVIVGAGPAGFAASLAAMQRRLRSVTIEQETLGGTVAHYPRGKIVMTAPAVLPLYGKLNFRETTKEKLLEVWADVERRTGIRIRYSERMEAIETLSDGFEVRTTAGRYRTRSVVLCIGRRGTPRKLGVPGEDRSKVVYRLADPEQYADRHVLVAGGGDSALEAAVALSEIRNTTVTLSYRGASFSRAKQKNRQRVDAAVKAGRLDLLLESEVVEVGDRAVLLREKSGEREIRNDAVIVCAGGILPTEMLRGIGIEIETKYGTV
jgi:thioredoxin reductase/NAD-dependent dihydropyrimidine dehydrogenase PreA subunit